MGLAERRHDNTQERPQRPAQREHRPLRLRADSGANGFDQLAGLWTAVQRPRRVGKCEVRNF